MKRVTGSKNIGLIERVNPMKNKWHVRWDEKEVNETNASYMEEEFDHKPTIDEIRAVITGWHNEEIDQKILSGFRWRDMPVWLSSENQFNFKAAFDLAYQTSGETLPVTFKFGTDDEPVYHVFETLDEMQEFYMASIAYMQQVLNEGWKKKGAVNWGAYILE